MRLDKLGVYAVNAVVAFKYLLLNLSNASLDKSLSIGKTVEELYELVGQPESSDYAPSCLGPGEDGNLYYDGFTVYTYRENDTETVRVVE